ncbi:hypothetical protein MRX96_010499 [Rhipicephalus microplus]
MCNAPRSAQILSYNPLTYRVKRRTGRNGARTCSRGSFILKYQIIRRERSREKTGVAPRKQRLGRDANERQSFFLQRQARARPADVWAAVPCKLVHQPPRQPRSLFLPSEPRALPSIRLSAHQVQPGTSVMCYYLFGIASDVSKGN